MYVETGLVEQGTSEAANNTQQNEKRNMEDVITARERPKVDETRVGHGAPTDG